MTLSDYTMSAAAAAVYLDLSLGYLYTLISRDLGPRHIRYGRIYRFRRQDLDAWIEQRSALIEDQSIQPVGFMSDSTGNSRR
mgnify:CR=1 FL=1